VPKYTKRSHFAQKKIFKQFPFPWGGDTPPHISPVKFPHYN